MAGGSVFISYRREDAAGEAGRLSDHFTRRFGQHRVFIDIDAIAPGTDFVAALDSALSKTTVVLVVIGRQWLTVKRPDGTRRIDDPADFVRREIQTALGHSARVIPVLVQGAAMPAAADLPADLAPLATRQAMAIQHEEFASDTQRLEDAVAPLVEEPRAWAGPGRARALIAGALIALALGLAGWIWHRASFSGGAPRTAAQAEADTARRTRQRQVDDLVRVANDQHGRGQLADAMATLDRAVAIDADVTGAKTRQEDVAMQWIRELTIGDGQTFADAMKQPLAVLDRAAPFATGARQGDLLAHLGWATFLRRRDGDRNAHPEEVYRKAIAADPTNPFANAMLGHWTLWERGDAAGLEQARPFFRVAADAGRATDVVRNLQLSALDNHQTVASRLEAVRVLDEMRRRGETLRPSEARRVWSTYYFALGDVGGLTSAALIAALPPAEHLLTFQWAFGPLTQEDPSKSRQFRYYVARLQAAAGRTAEARAALQALEAEFGPRSGGRLPDAVTQALQALGASATRAGPKR